MFLRLFCFSCPQTSFVSKYAGNTQQRDLMEALVQAYGYAPRFLAACHSFLTARETYKLAANIQRYFIRWADGKPNLRDPIAPKGTLCISANVEAILVYIPEEHQRPGPPQPFLERVSSPALFTSRPFMGGHERVRSSTGARVMNADRAGPYQRRLFGSRFTSAALGFLVTPRHVLYDTVILHGLLPKIVVRANLCNTFDRYNGYNLQHT